MNNRLPQGLYISQCLFCLKHSDPCLCTIPSLRLYFLLLKIRKRIVSLECVLDDGNVVWKESSLECVLVVWCVHSCAISAISVSNKHRKEVSSTACSICLLITKLNTQECSLGLGQVLSSKWQSGTCF